MFISNKFIHLKNDKKITSLILFIIVLVAVPVQGQSPDMYVNNFFKDSEILKINSVPYGALKNEFNKMQTYYAQIFNPIKNLDTKRPLIIFINGGGFVKIGNSIDPLALEFAKKGYVTAIISYSIREGENEITPNSPMAYVAAREAQVSAQAAIRFFKSKSNEFKIDPNKIGIVGNSAGGVTALYLGYDYEEVKLGGNEQFSNKISALASISGALLVDDIKSGIVSENDPPAIMFNGEQDTTVPFSMAYQTKSALESKRVPIKFNSYPDAGHDLIKNKRNEIIDKLTVFFKSNLAKSSSNQIQNQPLKAVCVVDKKNIKIGDSVTYVVNATGGSGKYLYALKNDFVNYNKKTVKYSTAGRKDLVVRVLSDKKVVQAVCPTVVVK